MPRHAGWISRFPGLALAHELYLALRAQGGGRKGTQALVLALARLSDVDWTSSAGGSPAK